MKRRPGYSLIECLAAIAMIGAAMTIAAVSMNGMHRAGRQVHSETAGEMELQRLAVQLRADAHKASSATLDKSENKDAAASALSLIQDDKESIRYALQPGHVLCEQRRGDELLHRETYRLPEAYTANWELNTDDSSSMVTLTLKPEPIGISGPAGDQPLQIKAAVGLLKRPPVETKP